MKTKIKRFSKSVLSVILAMTLIMSTMLIGTISVNAAFSKLYVTGSAASGWGNWTELSSTTADGTIAYTTITGGQAFKVSTKSGTYNVYDGVELDNTLGDVTISNGPLTDNKDLSTSASGTIYLCVQVSTGKIYASTTEPSSGSSSGGGGDEPTEKFYIEYYDGGHKYVDYTSYADGVFTWETKFDFGQFASDGKFRITNSKNWPGDDKAQQVCVSAYKVKIATSGKNVTDYVDVSNASGVTINTSAGDYGVSQYYDIVLNDVDTSKTYIVTYKPGTTNPLDGKITIADKSVTPTLATPKIKGDSAVLPNSTITVALDNQKDFGKDEDGDKVYTANDDSLTFTYTVTASDGSTPEVTPTASGKILASDGTTAINDKISFTASATEGVTYTITCKVSADGFDDVTSSELTVKVGTVSFAQSGRLYAYAGTLADSATPDPQAWIAAENNAIQQAVYKTNTSSNNYPTLGSASSTDLRIFLPTSASDSSVVLYNNYSSSITLKNSTTNAETTINSGEKATVAYAPGQSFTFTADGVDRTLVIYKSSAQGALYLNNTGNFAGYTDAGVPKMIEQLYTGKDKGELADGTGNAGAYSDKNGNVVNAAVKKIKGRGNSTWNYTDKKSFNVTFTDKFKGFGFSGKKFSLLANFKDPSLSRNNILYQLADFMGAKYSPNVATVDLYMNGLYMGSYLMCQKVEVGSSDLVNDQGVTDTLLDLDTATAETAAAGFSFLIELDSNSTDGADYKIEVGSQKITLKEPEYLNDSNNKYNDALTTAIDTYVTGKYNALNTAMSNTSITYNELNAIIDVKSLANYYLLNELAKNYDIGVTSTYLVYNKTDEKFYISPVWDLDVSTCNSKTDSNYTSFEGNWTDKNSDYNYFMKKVFANPQVQSAARAKWTDSYYTELVNEINELADGAITNISGSYENNFKKWSYPYGFTGQGDSIVELTSLTTASYDVSTHTYSKASSATSYGSKTAEGTINYVRDWLLRRVAWMTNKYNTYTLSGYSGWSDASAVTNSSVNGVTTWKLTSSSSTSAFKISTDGYAGRDLTDACINYDTSVKIVNDSSVATISAASGTNMNFGFTSTGTISESSPVYLIYNQKTNTLTLSDTLSTSSNPTVTLSGSTVDNADIKDGTAVTLTATITPATKNNVVVTGDYTATLYIGDRVVKTEKVNFTNTDESKVVTFSTLLEGTNQTYKVVVTCNDGEQVRTGTSKTVTYKQGGIKDQKIYFDPSTHTASNSKYDWLEATTKDSTVTVTIKNSSSVTLDTFTMYIDSDDIHGLDKGVFRGDISEETLAYFKDSSNTITFTMDNTSLTCSVAGQSDITSGWIYNYSSQVDTDDDNSKHSQALWEQYNVEYVEAYPGGCTTYAGFKDYLAEQKRLFDNGEATDNIVYFDNSASKWYNVYIYGWGSTGPTKNAVLMNKLPYADIWYYDFGSDNVTASFLFKDRSNRGYGNNYQQTVDLVNDFVKNGDNEQVDVKFESTIDTANPIFITQNFYKVTQRKGEGVHKFRAFNTQWDEFADVVASEVQTKAVDIYFDLHEGSATDIQLYHTSTNSKYTFASEFTRLTQMSGSTIYHSTIMLPYTEKDGIAFKFDKFVVNYSNGTSKTCAMSAKVQPEFKCINTGEVWYEINSDFANLGYDTAARSASLLTANSPLLTATYTDIYLIGGMNSWTESDANWRLSSTDGNKYTGTFTISGGSSAIAFKVFDSSNSGNKYFANGNYQFNSSNTIALGLNNNDGTAEMSIMPIATSGNITLNVTYYREYSGQTRLEITQTVAIADATYYVAGDRSIINSPFTGSEAKMSKNESGVYYYHFTDIAAGDYNFKITDGSSNWDVANWSNYSPVKSSLTNITVSNPNSYNKIKVSLSSTTSFTVYYDETNVYIIEDSSTPTPTISLSAASTSLTLVDGVATTTLTTTKTNAGDATVTYSVDPSSGATVSADGTTFTATAAGTYVVTASITVNGTTYSAPVTIIVSEEVTEDYCGVLAYNHSTATFDVTGGGTIDKTDVVLTNGYYITGNVTTGYTSYDGTTYTVIYALPSTASSGATTSYSSTTSHTDSNYEFNDWTKNGIVKSTVTALSDEISGTSTVAYVANWSLVKKVSYTFTYKYYEFDTSKGMAYADGRATILNDGYVIQVTLPENSSDDVIKAAYLANAPKLESDYYIYTFDGVDISVNGLYASAIANNDTIRYYTVRFDNGDTTTVNNYYYQHVAELSYDGTVPTGKYVAWMNENGEILHYGTTYKFRVTRNIDIQYAFVDSDSVSPATYVNEPTYEFYINNTGKEYVRFNILVENVLADLSIDNVEFGTLYFFTDSTGKPNDSTISVETDLDPNTLITVSEDGKLNVKSGVGQHNVNTVSSEYKYIYAPKMPNTSANVDRYVRVYSYIAVKDDNGKYTNVIVSNSYALASIRDALNKS